MSTCPSSFTHPNDTLKEVPLPSSVTSWGIDREVHFPLTPSLQPRGRGSIASGTALEPQRDTSEGWSCKRKVLEGKASWLVGKSSLTHWKSGYTWSWGVVGDGLPAVHSNPAPLPERAVTAEFCSVPLRECSRRAVHFFSCAQLLAKDATSASLCWRDL